MKKKLLTTALAAALAGTALVGCGGTSVTEPSGTADTAATAQATTAASEASTSSDTASGDSMTIMWWGSDARHEATNKVLEMYTEKTGVQFSPEYTGWDGYWQRMPVLAASNSMPDILQMDAAYIKQYAENGQLADLTDLVDLSGYLTDEEIEKYKIDGKLYGVPLSRNGQGLAYSKTKLAELGIDEPQNGWTWDDYVAWGEKAAEKCPDGVYPLYDMRHWYTYYQEYAESQGKPKTLDGNEFNFDKDTFKDYCNMYQKLVDEGVALPADKAVAYVELDPVNDYFLNGSCLTRSISVGSVASLAEMMGEDNDLGFVCLPQGSAGSASWVQSTVFFSIGANSTKKEEAAKFLEYFISDVDAGKVLQTVRGLPLSDDVYAEMEPDLNQYQLKSMELYKALTDDSVKAMAYQDDVPATFTDWGTEFKAQTEAIMLGQTSVDDAADYLETVGQEAAAEAAGSQ